MPPSCCAKPQPQPQTNTYIYIYIYIDIYPPFTKNSPPLDIPIIYLSVHFHLTNKLNYPLDLLMPPPNISLPQCWAKAHPSLRQIHIYTDISPSFFQISPPSDTPIYMSVKFNLINESLRLTHTPPPHIIYYSLALNLLTYRYMLFNSSKQIYFLNHIIIHSRPLINKTYFPQNSTNTSVTIPTYSISHTY